MFSILDQNHSEKSEGRANYPGSCKIIKEAPEPSEKEPSDGGSYLPFDMPSISDQSGNGLIERINQLNGYTFAENK